MKTIFALFLLLLSVVGSEAGVVFQQLPNGTGTLLASSRYQANGTDYDQYVWDAFTVPTAQAVTEIRWRGGYDPGMAYWAGQVATFKVLIYESTPGLSQPLLGPLYPGSPATLAAYDTNGRAGETLVGVVGGVPVYEYRHVLPVVFQAQAGKEYWVQIEAEVVGGLPSWGLSAATGNGFYFRRIPGQADYYFQFISGDAAFSLLSADGPIYTVEAVASPAEGGTITGTGLYPDASAAPLVAVPNPGYAFANWTDQGVVVSSAAAYRFTVHAHRSLVANFVPGSVITLTSAPLLGGAVNGAGAFANGSSRTVEAAPAGNYLFVHWTENGVPVSTSANYTFTVTADRELVANFTASATNLGLVFAQPPLPAGTLYPSAFLTPGGIDGEQYTYEKFTSVTTAPITDLRWRGGYQSGYAVSNPVVEFVIKFYASTANGFYPDLAGPVLKTVRVTGNANQTPAGAFGGVQMYDYQVTLPTSFLATGGTPYWVQIEASQASYPIDWGIASAAGGDGAHYRKVTGGTYASIGGDLAIALSSPVPLGYAIAAAVGGGGGGSVTGAGTFAPEAVVNLSATPAAGHAFVQWTENGVLVGTTPLHSFSATAERSLMAHFAPTFALTLSSSSTSMGTVTGGGTYPAGATAMATAVAKPGFVFVAWLENGVPISKLATYAFPMVGARTLQGSFAVGFVVNASASASAAGLVAGAGGYAVGSAVTLTATAATGYRFSHWSEGGVAVGESSSIDFNAAANRTLVANFVPVVTIVSDAANALTLRWPASAAGWVLQECTDLGAAAGWLNSTREVGVVASENEVTIPTPNSRIFFRLRQP